MAIDAADIVLMKSSLLDVPAAIRLSRATLRNIHENLFWAFIYNVIGIPLAAGVFISMLGWQLNPMFAAAAMSLSSFCVVSNALRLNLFKMYDSRRDHKIKNILKEEKEIGSMNKIMKIEGMMCGHCEAAVKKALEALPQVDSAEVSQMCIRDSRRNLRFSAGYRRLLFSAGHRQLFQISQDHEFSGHTIFDPYLYAHHRIRGIYACVAQVLRAGRRLRSADTASVHTAGSSHRRT